MVILIAILEYVAKIILMIPVGIIYIIGFLIRGTKVHEKNGYCQELWQYCTNWNPNHGSCPCAGKVSDKYW